MLKYYYYIYIVSHIVSLPGKAGLGPGLGGVTGRMCSVGTTKEKNCKCCQSRVCPRLLYIIVLIDPVIIIKSGNENTKI